MWKCTKLEKLMGDVKKRKAKMRKVWAWDGESFMLLTMTMSGE